MALAYTNVVELDSDTNPQGKVTRVVACTATFDASYPTGGEVITPASISSAAAGALTAVDFVVVASHDTDGVTRAIWDRANAKLMLWIDDGSTGVPAQAANASDQSAKAVELLIYGS